MMTTTDLFLLAVGLAMDCLTVSIVSGVILRRPRWAVIIRMAVLFGAFQALMPLLGWMATASLSHYVEAAGHWVAFLLLACIGGKMIWESLSADEHQEHFDPTLLRTQLLLAVATSIDALAVGISLACIGYATAASLVLPLTIIGLVSLFFAVAGHLLGIGCGTAIARRTKPELLGGLVLLFIGMKILLSGLL